ncbi:MAG TPA: hypothetical protein VKG45_00955, partial [Actinomycetes bacterium]|nr:hypothetical protein [Actinomycetes bacterium]
HPGDVPPAFAGLAAVLTAVSAPPRPSELAAEEQARAAFRAAARPDRARRLHRPRGRMLRVRSLRVAIVLVLALLIITGAALATGAVPAPSWPFLIPGAVHFHGRPDATTPRHERPAPPTTADPAGTCQGSCPDTSVDGGAGEQSRSKPGPPGQESGTGGDDHRAKPPPGRGGWGSSHESARGEPSRHSDWDDGSFRGREGYLHEQDWQRWWDQYWDSERRP